MLNKFIEYNHQCPLCDRGLTLYMRWVDSLFFKGEKIGDNHYAFNTIMVDKNVSEFEGQYMTLKIEGDDLITEFSSDALKNEAKKHQIYFFNLCNEKGIKSKSWSIFEISLYSGCYYRSTPFFEFKRNDNEQGKEWSLDLTNHEYDNMVNKDESWCFVDEKVDLEKVYMMSLDSERKETSLFHYTVTDEQMKTKGWKPNLFQKKIPLLKKRPDLDPAGIRKLIERFESWIIMS